jgi:hypothetical protein
MVLVLYSRLTKVEKHWVRTESKAKRMEDENIERSYGEWSCSTDI